MGFRPKLLKGYLPIQPENCCFDLHCFLETHGNNQKNSNSS